VIHAVEENRLRATAIDDALKRHQRAKERFLATSVADGAGARPLAGRALRAAIGRDEHRAIADEMKKFL
jgi:hypothetical protein